MSRTALLLVRALGLAAAAPAGATTAHVVLLDAKETTRVRTVAR